MHGLINRKGVREFALEEAEKRHHKFTRVDRGLLDAAEAVVKKYVADIVRAHPTNGKTLRPF